MIDLPGTFGNTINTSNNFVSSSTITTARSAAIHNNNRESETIATNPTSLPTKETIKNNNVNNDKVNNNIIKFPPQQSVLLLKQQQQHQSSLLINNNNDAKVLIGKNDKDNINNTKKTNDSTNVKVVNVTKQQQQQPSSSETTMLLIDDINNKKKNIYLSSSDNNNNNNNNNEVVEKKKDKEEGKSYPNKKITIEQYLAPILRFSYSSSTSSSSSSITSSTLQCCTVPSYYEKNNNFVLPTLSLSSLTKENMMNFKNIEIVTREIIQNIMENGTLLLTSVLQEEKTIQIISMYFLIDMLNVFISYYQLPQRLLISTIRRSRGRNSKISSTFTTISSNRRQNQIIISYYNTDDLLSQYYYSNKIINGLRNYGQTCFLNSVLQCLSSLPIFLIYLQRICLLSTNNNNNNHHDDNQVENSNVLFSDSLLNLLCNVNNITPSIENKNTRTTRRSIRKSVIISPRDILHCIGKKNKQFQPKYGGGLGITNTTEQQDAQELLQALIQMIIDDYNNIVSPASLIIASQDTNDTTATTTTTTTNVTDNNNHADKCNHHQSNKKELVLDDCYSLTQHDALFTDSNTNILSSTKQVKDGEEKKQNDYDDDFPPQTQNSENKSSSKTLTETTSEQLGRSILAKTDNNVEETLQKANDDNKKVNPDLSHMMKKNNDKKTDLPAAPVITMLKSISSISPSPLSGWIGSTIQCMECKYVRTIQNLPFLDIPIIPTAVSQYHHNPKPTTTSSSSLSSYFPSCTLYDCLNNYTEQEIVHDVECISCTIKEQISNVQDDLFMLKDAINTINSRNKKIKRSTGEENNNSSDKNAKGKDDKDGTKALYQDLVIAQEKLSKLQTINYDNEDDVDLFLSTFKSNDDSASMLLDSTICGHSASSLHNGNQNNKLPLQRCTARKGLLLTRLPSILCFHVQRRYYDPVKDCMGKAMQHIDFPEILDVSKYFAYSGRNNSQSGASTSSNNSAFWTNCKEPPVDGNTTNTATPSQTTQTQSYANGKPILYRLMSIIEHKGNAFGGHYQTYRRASSSSWVFVSDLQVKEIRWNDVKQCQAYMLFYEAM